MPATTHSFVGRDRELGQLRACVEDAASGRGHLVLLAGPAGIGKTRIADELSAQARALGATVLWGRCWEGEGAPSFWPWVQAIRTYVRGADAAVLRGELGAGAGPIAELIDEVRTRFPDLSTPAPLDAEQARFRLFDSVATFLANAARRQPLVLVFDDLHWADIPSLRLLRFVAQETRNAGVFLMGTVRDPELPPDDPVTRAVAALGREGERISLSGLSLDDIWRLAESVGGVKREVRLIEELYRRTDGNPFFAAEILRLWAAEGYHGAGRSTLPSSVRQTIRRRIDRLSPGGQRVLPLAAVIGREFPLALLERLLTITSELSGTRAQILALLDEAETLRLIEPAPSSPKRYRFAHALVREALCEELGSAHREGLHRDIGAAIEEVYANDLEPHIAELAHHFVAAAPASDLQRTIAYATRAGERALRLLAYEDAADHFRGALHAMELAGQRQRASADYAKKRCELLLALGEAYARAGEKPAARDAFLHAVALARPLGAVDVLGRAALGIAGSDVTTRVDAQQVALLEEALTACGEQDSSLRARLLSRLAAGLYFSEARERRVRLSREAVAIAERLGDAQTLASVLGAQHFALWEPDGPGDRLAIADRIITLSEHTGRRDLTLRGHFWRLVDALELGDITAVDHSLYRYSDLARDLRLPYHIWRARVMESMMALLEGRFADGERLVEEAMVLGQRARSPNASLIYGVQLYGLRREQGRLRELEPMIAAFAAEHEAIPAFQCGQALLYCHLGRTEEARAILDRLAANDFNDLPRDNNWLNAMDELTQVCATLDDQARAATLYARLLPYAGQNVVIAFAEGCDGSVARYLGLLATTLSRWDDAARHFETALAMNQRIRARPLQAHTQREYAVMLLKRRGPGDLERAQALLTAACALYSDLGMSSYLDRARALKPDPQPVTFPGVGSSPAGDSGVNRFEKQSEYWTLTYASRTTRLRDSKGLRYLACLLREPGREFHVADLVRATAGEIPESKTAMARRTGSSDLRGRTASRSVDLDIPDAHAKAAYRRRLEGLRDVLEEAERFNDTDRAERARAEMEFIATELRSAYHLHSSRKSSEPVEKIRKAVTNCIRDVFRKLQRQHEPLWRHFYASVRTGTFCVYQPESPISWLVVD